MLYGSYRDITPIMGNQMEKKREVKPNMWLYRSLYRAGPRAGLSEN